MQPSYHMLHSNLICIKLFPLIDTESYLREHFFFFLSGTEMQNWGIVSRTFFVWEICWVVFFFRRITSIDAHTHTNFHSQKCLYKIEKHFSTNYVKLWWNKLCKCECEHWIMFTITLFHFLFRPLEGRTNGKKASRLQCMHNNLKCKFKSHSVECFTRYLHASVVKKWKQYKIIASRFEFSSSLLEPK